MAGCKLGLAYSKKTLARHDAKPAALPLELDREIGPEPNLTGVLHGCTVTAVHIRQILARGARTGRKAALVAARRQVAVQLQQGHARLHARHHAPLARHRLARPACKIPCQTLYLRVMPACTRATMRPWPITASPAALQAEPHVKTVLQQSRLPARAPPCGPGPPPPRPPCVRDPTRKQNTLHDCTLHACRLVYGCFSDAWL